MNLVTLMGRITAAPELKTTSSGINYCRFTLAVDRKFQKQGGERQTDFINCVAWRQSAEFICRYFVKGQLMAVTGSIQTGSYTDNTGAKRYTTDVVVDNAYFTGDKRENNNAGARNTPPDDYYENNAPAAPVANNSFSNDNEDFVPQGNSRGTDKSFLTPSVPDDLPF